MSGEQNNINLQDVFLTR